MGCCGLSWSHRPARKPLGDTLRPWASASLITLDGSAVWALKVADPVKSVV